MRQRSKREPMNHAYLREMIDKARETSLSILLEVDEAEALVSEFIFYQRLETGKTTEGDNT